MRIAVNTRLLLNHRLEGIGWFSCESLRRIVINHPEHEFLFIFDRPWNEQFVFASNVTPLSVFPPARHPLLYYLWFEHALPSVFKKYKPDLFLSPDGYLSLRSDIRSVNVFHDLNFEHYPSDLPLSERFFYRRFFPRYARKATRIATVSEYSKNDIIATYKINPGKIDVVYNGIGEFFHPLTHEEKQLTRVKYSNGKPYFIFVGALHPRKNLINLFKAFDLFRNRCDETVHLLIVGAKKWWTPAIEQAYNDMKFRNDVIFTGRLHNSELNMVLSSALALTYVSYFEGFGIPILEAFRCETPVITSNVTSMPEVAGEAALLVNPFSVSSIAEAMNQVHSDLNLRNQLINKGKLRSAKFSWDQTATRLWETIIRATQT